MASPADDLATLVQAAGHGTRGTDIFVNILPDSPDACVAVYDTGGGEPNLMSGVYRPRVMIKVRGGQTGQDTSYSLATAVRDSLTALQAQTVNGTWYIGFWVISDIAWLGRDDRQRPLWSVNFLVRRGE